MRTAQRRRLLPLTAVILIAAALLIFFISKKKPADETDPHAGQVLINDGFADVWITPLEGVDVNTLSEEEFRTEDGELQYTGAAFDTIRGIDVSEHQHEIDWQQVADSGVEFAFIRTGYRGYTAGGLNADAYYEQNLHGALSAGLQVGVYFFSQATNVAEAIEEANYILDQIEDYDITLPVMYDWEKIEGVEYARTDNISSDVVSDCGVAFCETVKAAGYDAGIYFNRQLGYYYYDLSRLTDFKFWVTVPGDFPDFYYAGNVWQYSFTETVPGIEGETDMNLLFIPKPEPEPEPTPAA